MIAAAGQDVRRGDPMLWGDSEAERLWTKLTSTLKKHKTQREGDREKEEL